MRPSQKEKILEATLYCFATFGYEATKIRHIAQQAKVSEGALYRHFSSKEAIAQTIYLSHLQDFSEGLKQISESHSHFEAKLGQVVKYFLNYYRAHPEAFIFMLTGDVPFVEQLLAEVVLPIQVLKNLIHSGQVEGHVRSGDPGLLAAIFFGGILQPIMMSELGFCGVHGLRQLSEQDETLIGSVLSAVLPDKIRRKKCSLAC